MRVLIASSCSPFSGREEWNWVKSLKTRLKNMGMDVDSFVLPFVNNPLLIPEQMMALRLLDVEHSSDLLIAVGYPTFVLKHPHKRVLLFSLASSLHEHFDTEYGVISTMQYQHLRDAVYGAEKKCLLEAERILCASETLAAQIKNLYQLQAEAFICGSDWAEDDSERLLEDGTWVFCESTLEPLDRMDLLLNAAKHAQTHWQLMICIPAASDIYRQALHQHIERLGLTERVRIKDASLPFQNAATKAKGFVSLSYKTTRVPESLLRAMQAGIPVVTATDCGAVLEVIQNETNGLVVPPSAKEIARALDILVYDTKLHQRLSRGHGHSNRKFTSIERVIESLVE